MLHFFLHYSPFKLNITHFLTHPFIFPFSKLSFTTNKLTRLLIYYLLEGQNNVLMTSKPMKLRHLSDDELRNWARQYAVPSFDKLDRDSLLRY